MREMDDEQKARDTRNILMRSFQLNSTRYCYDAIARQVFCVTVYLNGRLVTRPYM